MQQPAAHIRLHTLPHTSGGWRAPWVVEHKDSVDIHLSATGLKDGRSGCDEAPTGFILYAGDESINLAEEQPVQVQTAI